MQVKTKAPWMQSKERGSMRLLRFMTWISLKLGRSISRTIVWFIALYFLLASPQARRSSSEYLQRSLGRRPKLADVFRHFLCFASTIHDRLYLLNDRLDLFKIEVSGDEAIQKSAADGRGVLLLGAHLGSFEVLRTMATLSDNLALWMAMYPENAQKINSALEAINPAALQNIIALGKIDSILEVRDKLNESCLVGVLADRAAGASEYDQHSFLGEVAGFPKGPFRLAAMLQCPVYFMAGIYRGGNNYALHFELLFDPKNSAGESRRECELKLAENYVNTLEGFCRKYPYNWFNFYDFWNTDQNTKKASV